MDTGKIRYVFRNFPLNIKALACEMLARNIARDDAVKYFAVVDIMFRQQDQLVEKTGDTLKLIRRQPRLSVQAGEDCLKGQAMQHKIAAVQTSAEDDLRTDGPSTLL